ncbi:hypothetical protein EROM_040490 [Encephalitozoon romaleae SJ-2008]|uniref:Uncharacterized protein n=1 Tax=Encephalitozoon romaleae (strain SJ-2008) TaxID=1178016 RepID=I7AR44_ENCRO|nr:hypothetical protein EROM_040490 [Encephalitozoon romaleae SJ-2008]AFN82817.1 hypothetical protein EROM_040490 [Encephalitozoon romaleae SJ-2008]
MKPSRCLKKLLKIDISPDSSYSEIEIGLYNLKRIVKSTSQKEVVRGGVRKMALLFHSKNWIARSLALKYFSKINKYVDEVDTNILHMFYSTDPRINDLAVKYVDIFSRFFKDNDTVFYHVYRSRSKYRRGAMKSLISQSPRYRPYEKDCEGEDDDLDLFKNIRRNTAEEYFGRLALPKLVRLSSTYPCLIKYFKFTEKFLMEEVRKADRYPPDMLRRLEMILGIEKEGRTMWDEFMKCSRWMEHGKFDRSVRVLKRLQNLDISKEYKIIFGIFARKMMFCLGLGNEMSVESLRPVISGHFEAELSGISQNGVYRVLRRLFKNGMKRMDTGDRKTKND